MYEAKLCLWFVYYSSACLSIQINISVIYGYSVASYLMRNFKKVKTLFLWLMNITAKVINIVFYWFLIVIFVLLVYLFIDKTLLDKILKSTK